MIKSVKIYLLFFVFFFAKIQIISAQRAFKVSIDASSLFLSKGEKIACTYDDGIKAKVINKPFINNKLSFSGGYYSRFATLYINFRTKDSTYYNQYFVGTKAAKLRFLTNSNTSIKDPFRSCSLTNMYEISQSKSSKRRSKFSQIEINEMNTFNNKYGHLVGRNDSISYLFYQKLHNVNVSDLKFVEKNRDKYFSFWFFRTSIIPSTFGNNNEDVLQYKKLLSVYNQFPNAFKFSIEGQNVKKILLEGISRKISEKAVKTNTKAPDFLKKDIAGNTISSNCFKDKYTLLVFWATWCPPCMKEIPMIKKIRESYDTSKLNIVGISIDRDYDKFISEIKKNQINWTQIYNKSLATIYGINAIPAIFLIDKNGIIIYSSKEQKESTLIELLEKI